MRYQVIQAPTEEPLTLAEARQHLRIPAEVTDEDPLIQALIQAVRQFAEGQTSRFLVTQRVLATADCFSPCMTIDRAGVQSITAIRYLDLAGVWQTVPTTDWVADPVDPVRITPRFGRIWPVPMPQIASVQIEFMAGYGPASAVPEGIKSWMKMRLASLYENREEAAIMHRGSIQPLPYVDRLLDPFTLQL